MLLKKKRRKENKSKRAGEEKFSFASYFVTFPQVKKGT